MSGGDDHGQEEIRPLSLLLFFFFHFVRHDLGRHEEQTAPVGRVRQGDRDGRFSNDSEDTLDCSALLLRTTRGRSKAQNHSPKHFFFFVFLVLLTSAVQLDDLWFDSLFDGHLVNGVCLWGHFNN